MAKIKKGKGSTVYGPGIEIRLSGTEVARAIHAYLVAKGIYIDGHSTVRVNEKLCDQGSVYVDPSGMVIKNGVRYLGKTGEAE